MQTFKTALKNWSGFIALWIILFLINKFLVNICFIPSESMEPFLKEGDFIITTCFDKSEIDRYDIITFKNDDNNKILIKRVIGMPGDTVEIVPDNTEGISHVYINGEKVDESFILEPMDYTDYQIFKVPEDNYFCLGDNRNNSIDSRYLTNPYISSKNVKSIFKFKLFNIYFK